MRLFVDMLAIIIGLSLTIYIIALAIRNMLKQVDGERRRDFADAIVLALGLFYFIKIVTRELIPYFLHTSLSLHTGFGHA